MRGSLEIGRLVDLCPRHRYACSRTTAAETDTAVTAGVVTLAATNYSRANRAISATSTLGEGGTVVSDGEEPTAIVEGACMCIVVL